MLSFHPAATPPTPVVPAHLNSPRLFEMCVPVLTRYLGSLARVLQAVDDLPPAQAQAVFGARLAPDMLPFSRQVETAAFFALRTAYPLAGRPVPAFEGVTSTLSDLRSRVASTLVQLQALSPAEFSGAEDRTLVEQAGSARVELPAEQFLVAYALPNFLFHLGMAYAIARQHGAALGKADYDGFHVYERGDS